MPCKPLDNCVYMLFQSDDEDYSIVQVLYVYAGYMSNEYLNIGTVRRYRIIRRTAGLVRRRGTFEKEVSV